MEKAQTLTANETNMEKEPSNAPMENNQSEASASIKIDPTAFVKKSIDPSKQYDSEGMCVEE